MEVKRVLVSHLSLQSLKLVLSLEVRLVSSVREGKFPVLGMSRAHHPRFSLYKHPKENLANGSIFAGHTF